MLKKIQQDSHDKFEALGYPSKKLENWKFSPSNHLKKYSSKNLDQSNFSIEKYSDKYTLCFINGELATESLNHFIYNDYEVGQFRMFLFISSIPSCLWPFRKSNT